MPSNIRLASYPPQGKDREVKNAAKRVVLKLVIVCMTLIAFIWLTRGSLCELRIRLGDSEVAATLAYESER